MEHRINQFKNGERGLEKLEQIFQGWQAYAKWANTYKLRKKIFSQSLNI